jgi:aspartate racemase
MKTLGLIGGMSWESTAIYYRLINEAVRDRLGGVHSAKLLLWSFDFFDIAERQHAGDWAGATAMMVDAARKLEGGGAQAIVICTNTMHMMADNVQAAISIPIVHIADATANTMKEAGVSRPILLATRFTMEQDFYKGRLAAMYDIQPVAPDGDGRDTVHGIIYEELVRGIVKADSKAKYQALVARMRREHDVDSLIMGCTEITMLIGQDDFDIPVFDIAFPWPMSDGEWLAWSSAAVTVLLGLFSLFAPRLALRLLRLAPSERHPEAVGEVRSEDLGLLSRPRPLPASCSPSRSSTWRSAFPGLSPPSAASSPCSRTAPIRSTTGSRWSSTWCSPPCRSPSRSASSPDSPRRAQGRRATATNLTQKACQRSCCGRRKPVLDGKRLSAGDSRMHVLAVGNYKQGQRFS